MLCLVLVAVVCTGCVNIHTEKCGVAVKAECQKACPKDAKMLRHVVLFRFKKSTTPEQIKEVEAAFASLPDKIDAIKCFEWGTNVVTFANEAGLDAYLNHPDLKEFRKTLGGPLEKALVVDYWATHHRDGG
jgi:hypothetical protein